MWNEVPAFSLSKCFLEVINTNLLAWTITSPTSSQHWRGLTEDYPLLPWNSLLVSLSFLPSWWHSCSMSFVCSSVYFLLPCCRWSQNLPMNISFPPLPSSFPLSPSSPPLPSPRPSHWVSISNLHSSHTGPLTVSQEHPILSLLWDVIYVLLLPYIVVTICPSLPGSVLVYSCCLDINIAKLLFHTHTCSSSDDAF